MQQAEREAEEAELRKREAAKRERAEDSSELSTGSTEDDEGVLPLPGWFDLSDPQVNLVLPDLKLLHLLDRYDDENLRQSVLGRGGLPPKRLGSGLDVFGVAIGNVAVFLASDDPEAHRPTLDEFEGWMRKRGADDKTCLATRGALHVIRHGVQACITELDDLEEAVRTRLGLSPRGGAAGPSSSTAEPGASGAEQGPEPEKPGLCKAPRVRNNRYVTLPFLYDGTKERADDVALMHGLLMGKLDFAKVAKAKIYFSVWGNITALMRRARKGHAAVHAALDRLEAEYRIYRPIPSARGRNSILIHIGVHNRVLFAPALSPKRLWNLSMVRYLKAVKSGDASTSRQEAARLARHLQRVPDDDPDRPAMHAALAEIQMDCRET